MQIKKIAAAKESKRLSYINARRTTVKINRKSGDYSFPTELTKKELISFTQPDSPFFICIRLELPQIRQ